MTETEHNMHVHLYIPLTWVSLGIPVSSTNKTEILLKVALNTINPPKKNLSLGKKGGWSKNRAINKLLIFFMHFNLAS